jgi:hypothetical protein
MELANAVSSSDALRCFAPYHFDNVETIKGPDFRPKNLASMASVCLFFMDLPIPPLGRRSPRIGKLQKGKRLPNSF